jgi:hypothetical protein
MTAFMGGVITCLPNKQAKSWTVVCDMKVSCHVVSLMLTHARTSEQEPSLEWPLRSQRGGRTLRHKI